MCISKRLILMSSAAALLALSFLGTSTEPAGAQFGISLPGFGGLRFHFGPGCYRCGRRGGGHARHRGGGGGGSESSDDGAAPRKGKDEKVVVSAGAPTAAEQTAALRRVALASTASGDVGSAKDLKEVGKAIMNDRDRDYTTRIKEIIERFKKEQKQDQDSTPGDVTAAAIEQSLDKAFKAGKLDTFERFKTESWTTERLRTQILDRVQNQLDALFSGNNKGNAPMSQLDALIQRAAEDIYWRIFETSELLAANKSSFLFMQRLYQTHWATVKKEVLENADYIITKASLAALSPYEAGLQHEDKASYAYRYRGQRIVFDCLSENIEQIAGGGTTEAVPLDQVRATVMDTSNGVCAKWLKVEFGSSERKIKPQQPVPMRTVWTTQLIKEDERESGTLQ